MTAPKKYSCKVGTQPALVVLKRGYKVKDGAKIEFCHDRDRPNGRWTWGKITQVNADGYFFIVMI